MPPRPRSPPVTPYPWSALDTMTAAERHVLRDVRRAAAAFVRVESVAAAARSLVDAELRILVRAARAATGPCATAGALGVVIHASDPGSPRPILLAVEPALAIVVAARAIRRAPPRVVDLHAPLTEAVSGAFAAVVLALARRAHGAAPVRVADVGPAADVEAAWLAEGRDVIAVSLTVLLGDDAFAAHLLVPREVVTSAPGERPRARQTLEALGPLPLGMPVVAWASSMPLADVGALRAGDALTLPGWSLRFGGPRPPSGMTAVADAAAPPNAPARAWLAPPFASEGTPVEVTALGDEVRVVLRGPREPLGPAAPEDDMTRANAGEEAPTDLMDSVGDLPVLVRVEIGEASLPAREWAALAQGDVLPLGRRVGEPVLLRAAGLPVARGELVQIDGEVAVRILERIAANGPGGR